MGIDRIYRSIIIAQYLIFILASIKMLEIVKMIKLDIDKFY